MDLYSLYLHIPFCRHRCSYCDFNTFAGQERNIPAYVNAICNEIRQVGAAGRAMPPGNDPAGSEGARYYEQRIPVHTVFFGGGTPSLLSAEQLDTILETLRSQFDFQPGAEITLEANPGTVSAAYLKDLRQVGVNRLSFGMQSAHPDDLRLLERQHDFFDVTQAVEWARAAGFDNLSLDLIFGLPEQDLARWQQTIERALGMGTEHLSLYALTIEHGTPLHKRWSHGLIPSVDDDLAADMYEYAMDRLGEAGFVQYEISNWARTATDGRLLSARHNLQYWQNRPYLGFGAGAHGFAPQAPDFRASVRTMNVGGIRPFIERCSSAEQQVAQQPAAAKQPAAKSATTARSQAEGQPEAGARVFPAGPATRRTILVDRHMEMQETMMVGLRLTQQGVAERVFRERFGQPLQEVFGKEIERLLKMGLLEWVEGANDAGAALRLTRRGRMLGNQVFMQFVG